MTSSTHCHKLPARRMSRGFALVVTLSLMILLTIIAVGLLGLSAVSLRNSSQAMAQATAQSNARLALMLAIGELQKQLGPDRAITATSEILAKAEAPVTKPNTTGVWESWWDFNPSNAPDYSAEKTKRFRCWLVSNADIAAAASLDFPTTAWKGKTVELVGSGTLGDVATAAAKVTAGLVPVSKNGKVQGSYGWHVADESVKARINLYRDPSQNATLAQKRALLAGHRPDPSLIKGADGNLLTCLPTDLSPVEFKDASATVGKVLDLDQAELLDQAKDKIKPLRHDITPHSLGPLTDVRGGGLKQDLSSMFEMGSATLNTLPSEFNKKNLYQSTHGITGISDPKWSALAGYYNSFRSLTNVEASPSFTVKQAAISVDPVPESYNPAPVIAKVDTIFSLVARPTTDVYWINPYNPAVKDYHDYHLNLIFTPVVTLHNPYNVSISFHKMEVAFENIPIAFNFMLQAGGTGGFVSQSVEAGKFEPLNTMSYTGADHNGRTDKKFVMNIANWKDAEPITSSPDIVAPIVMKPGQTLVCGPYFPDRASFRDDASKGHKTLGFDWDNRLTKAIKARPRYLPGLGYEMYAVTIAHIRRPGGVYPGGWTGHPFMMLRGFSPLNPKTSKSTVTDNFYVEFKAQRPMWYQDDKTLNKGEASPTFEVKAKLQAKSSDSLADFAKLQFDYKDDATLKNIFNDRVYRYPPTGSYSVADCAAPGGVTYALQDAFVRQFAIFSAYSRTTNGGVYETGRRTKEPVDSPQLNLLQNGRLAGKPFLFHNPSRSNFITNMATEKPAVQAYELNFQPFLSKGDYEDYMDVDVANRTPSLTGNKSTSGIKSGSYLEVPSGPLQTIADFRRSNALTTSYLPQFVQPVSNSLLHPLMSADKVVETNPAITATTMLDHSVLANHALYDRFYFSTFATRGSTKPDAVFEQFMNGSEPLATQSFQPYLPGEKTVTSAKDELFGSGKPKDTAYKSAAEYQMIRGPFNVNSTSVQAWKAVLAAMNKCDVATLWVNNATLESRKTGGVPITAMSMVNGGAILSPAANAADIEERTSNWNGNRELTEGELEKLAKAIVEQVRDRGPFLSLSEFVNRQVGSTGPRTLRGALESAITESEINEKKNALFPDGYLDQVPITAMDVSDPKLYNYKTVEAATGNPAAGAPGWINQGDLLRILEPSATVRGDTFVIRTYGEAQDASGNITARAYAEAVVQRMPDYVNPVDRPSLNTYTDSNAAAANKTFGRRINVVFFRWLSGDEI